MRQKRLLNLILCLILAGGLGAGLSSQSRAADPSGNRELTPQQKQMSAVYAEHLTTSVCGDEYRDRFSRNVKMTPQERTQFTSHVTSACKCVYENMKVKMGSMDIVDYVMFTHGSYEKSSKSNPEYMAYLRTPDFTRGDLAYRGPDVRKECGFVK